MLNRYATLIAVILLTGCSLGMKATGSVVMLKGEAPIQPTPVEQVQLLLDTKKEGYDIVALINASASVTESKQIAIAEGRALQELKHQAALAGANGVVDVVREVLVGDALISTMNYGRIDDFNIGDYTTSQDHGAHGVTQVPYREYQTINTGQTSVSRSYTVYFRGKAVRL